MIPRTPEDVQAALDALGLNIRVRIFEQSTATSEQAAEAVGTELGSIAKSLCFVVDGKPVIVIAAGDRMVDTRKLGELYGVSRKKIKIADAETTIQATGYAPGGVPPVGHVQPLPVLIDSTLSRYPIIYGAAGSPHAIFPIPYEELIRITGGKVADITVPKEAKGQGEG
jgi:prolyl-tRNA editing enzyme YbaK/EbsC (Cys-tRNA(Pro) deacylase)